MTITLYDADPYQTGFAAKVMRCETLPEGKYAVSLDRTQFFPEQGGQTADHGVLIASQEGSEGGISVRVLDVQMQDGDIAHICDGPLPAGTEVAGEVDWRQRFDFMQQHTGEHIFSGLAHSIYGCTNVGFHLSANTVTMDYDKVLVQAQVLELEKRVNQVIWQDLAVRAWFPDADEQEHLTWRSKKEIDGSLRLVEIPGVDLCACCAPHVRRTGEIGLAWVVSRENYKGGTRLTIVCGSRALSRVREAQEILEEAAKKLQASEEQVLLRIGKLQEERIRAKTALQQTKEELLLLKAGTFPEGEPVVLFDPDVDPGVIRRVLNRLVSERDGICAVLTGSFPKSEFIMAGRNIDLRPVAEKLRQEWQGRCGGSSTMIQGSLELGAEEEAHEAFYRWIREVGKNR